MCIRDRTYLDLLVLLVSSLPSSVSSLSSFGHKLRVWNACSKSCLDFMTLSVKSRMGACDVCSIQECKCISPDWSGSVSNRIGSAVAALFPVGVVLFGPGTGTTISEGSLLVK